MISQLFSYLSALFFGIWLISYEPSKNEALLIITSVLLIFIATVIVKEERK